MGRRDRARVHAQVYTKAKGEHLAGAAATPEGRVIGPQSPRQLFLCRSRLSATSLSLGERPLLVTGAASLEGAD